MVIIRMQDRMASRHVTVDEVLQAIDTEQDSNYSESESEASAAVRQIVTMVIMDVGEGGGEDQREGE